MKQSGWNIPTCAGLKAIGLRIVGYFIVTFSEVNKTFPYLFFGCSRCNANKCIRIVTAMIIQLRRKIISFRLALLPDQGSLLIVMMHMVRKRAHVVKKLGIHWPAAMFIPQAISDQLSLQFINSIL